VIVSVRKMGTESKETMTEHGHPGRETLEGANERILTKRQEKT
jgi:hypothetical protein